MTDRQIVVLEKVYDLVCYIKESGYGSSLMAEELKRIIQEQKELNHVEFKSKANG